LRKPRTPSLEIIVYKNNVILQQLAPNFMNLDNEKHSDLSGFGTAYVNINGMKVADNIADYCQTDFLTGITLE